MVAVGCARRHQSYHTYINTDGRTNGDVCMKPPKVLPPVSVRSNRSNRRGMLFLLRFLLLLLQETPPRVAVAVVDRSMYSMLLSPGRLPLGRSAAARPCVGTVIREISPPPTSPRYDCQQTSANAVAVAAPEGIPAHKYPTRQATRQLAASTRSHTAHSNGSALLSNGSISCSTVPSRQCERCVKEPLLEEATATAQVSLGKSCPQQCVAIQEVREFDVG